MPTGSPALREPPPPTAQGRFSGQLIPVLRIASMLRSRAAARSATVMQMVCGRLLPVGISRRHTRRLSALALAAYFNKPLLALRFLHAALATSQRVQRVAYDIEEYLLQLPPVRHNFRQVGRQFRFKLDAPVFGFALKKTKGF